MATSKVKQARVESADAKKGTRDEPVTFSLPGRPVRVALAPTTLCRFLVSKGWISNDSWNGGEESTWMPPTTGQFARVPGKRDCDLPGQMTFHVEGIATTMKMHPLDVVLGAGGTVEAAAPAPNVAVRHALLNLRDDFTTISEGVEGAYRGAYREAARVVQVALDNATPKDTLDAAICRIIAVAGRGGVREDEVLRFLEALELDVDRGETRLAALVVADVLTWDEQKGRGRQDAPLVYRRGSAFGKVVPTP